MIITIIISIVFSVLLFKAIIETIWGTILIINGIFWHSIGYALNGLAFIVGLFESAIAQFRK